MTVGTGPPLEFMILNTCSSLAPDSGSPTFSSSPENIRLEFGDDCEAPRDVMVSIIVLRRFAAAMTVRLTALEPAEELPAAWEAAPAPFFCTIGLDAVRSLCLIERIGGGVVVWSSVPGDDGDFLFLLLRLSSGGEKDGNEVRKVGDGVGGLPLLLLLGRVVSCELRDRSDERRLVSRVLLRRRSIGGYLFLYAVYIWCVLRLYPSVVDVFTTVEARGW